MEQETSTDSQRFGVLKAAMMGSHVVFLVVSFMAMDTMEPHSDALPPVLALTALTAALAMWGWPWMFPQDGTHERAVTAFVGRLALAEAVTLNGLVCAMLVARATVILPFVLLGMILAWRVPLPEISPRDGM